MDMMNETQAYEVKNRDIPFLGTYPSIKAEVEKLEDQIEWERGRMLNITQHLSDMPSGGGGPQGLESAFAKLDDVQRRHQRKILDYCRKVEKMERIINSIESQNMRTFVIMKYVWDVPNSKIMDTLNISRRGFERAKKCVEEASSMEYVKWPEKYIMVND